MAPNSIDATVKAGSPAEVQVEEQSLGALPANGHAPPLSASTSTPIPFSRGLFSAMLQVRKLSLHLTTLGRPGMRRVDQ